MQLDQTFADKMVERAITECAEVHFAGDTRRARRAVLRGECEFCRCISKDLVRQIGEYLGQVDSTVKAVYQYEPSDDTQDLEGKNQAGIHFVVWVGRKSAALSALAETLEAALAASQRNLGCVSARPECFTLDMEMVSDREVNEKRGLGLLMDNSCLRAHLAWKRSDQPKPTPPEEVLESGRVHIELLESFDPELIPEERLIHHALTIERLSPEDQKALGHHLLELKVTLIRRLISDQLNYINIAKQWFTVADLADIYQHRLGFGRIGGKSAGMLLAGRILNEVADEALKACVQIPESFFLGSDLMYIFMAMNGLMHWNDQKYKPEDQIWAEYPRIIEDFVAGEFPPEILVELQAMLEEIGPHPIIVRSSSQLEDNFNTSFAGKYDSHFCPNRGSPEENLKALTQSIARTYASTFRPDALLYRRSRGLQDYDERMAVLIQAVRGEEWGRYYLPFGAGVGFSRNLYRWAPQIRREDGFARLVWGLGTRAVQRVGDDYPRLVALSHPTLQPDDSPEAIRYYSQRYVDLIDLEDNTLKTLPTHEVLTPRYPGIRLLVQMERDGYFTTPRSRVMESDIPKLAINFDDFLRRTPFAARLGEILHVLEKHWGTPVDVEFTVHIPDPYAIPPDVTISLLQCRPLPSLKATYRVNLPEHLPEGDIVFSSYSLVPQGYLPDIRYVIFVPPEQYFALPSAAARNELGRLVGRLDAALEEKAFMCVGPGRWGATNIDLGVYVSYADICHAGALVELCGKAVGAGPEPSLGTHFFQDLMEANIYPVAIDLDREETIFNREFFYHTPNSLQDWIEVSDELAASLRLIDVAAFRPRHHLELIMDDEKGQTVALVVADKQEEAEGKT
jgi:hypothetical protein